MTRVVFDISLSLDGYMTAPDPRPEEPMGDGGLRLVEWASAGDEHDRGVLNDGVASLGAVIAGRRTYETSLPWWGANGPSGDARVPVFVVSHSAPADAPDGGVYTFPGGIDEALEQARAAAAEKVVTVMGGARTGQQFLSAGLVDELSLHVVPVLLGGGTRMFENLAEAPVALEPLATIQTPNATHLRLRVLR